MNTIRIDIKLSVLHCVENNVWVYLGNCFWILVLQDNKQDILLTDMTISGTHCTLGLQGIPELHFMMLVGMLVVDCIFKLDHWQKQWMPRVTGKDESPRKPLRRETRQLKPLRRERLIFASLELLSM